MKRWELTDLYMIFSGNLPYQLLSHARRVVMAFPVNHEFDMTEIRFQTTLFLFNHKKMYLSFNRIRMLANVVDVFMIAESNITAGGDPKPLHFFEAFRSGFLAEFQHKILYVYRDFFPAGYVKDGWKADRCICPDFHDVINSEIWTIFPQVHSDTYVQIWDATSKRSFTR